MQRYASSESATLMVGAIVFPGLLVFTSLTLARILLASRLTIKLSTHLAHSDYIFGRKAGQPESCTHLLLFLQSPDELWKRIEGNKERDWYNASVAYWDRQEATFNGVLGGYGHVSEPDISESRKFLMKAMRRPLQEAAARQRKLTAIGETARHSYSSVCLTAYAITRSLRHFVILRLQQNWWSHAAKESP